MATYRQSAREEGLSPPKEFVLSVRTNERPSGVAMLQLFALPALVAAVTALLDRSLAVVSLFASFGWLVWRVRRNRHVNVTFRADERWIEVARVREPPLRFPIHDVTDVVLDTKSIQPVQDGVSAIPGMRLIDSRVGPEIDVARIALVVEHHDTPICSSRNTSRTPKPRAVRQLRVFLRKQGWLPESERESEA